MYQSDRRKKEEENLQKHGTFMSTNRPKEFLEDRARCKATKESMDVQENTMVRVTKPILLQNLKLS